MRHSLLLKSFLGAAILCAAYCDANSQLKAEAGDGGASAGKSAPDRFSAEHRAAVHEAGRKLRQNFERFFDRDRTASRAAAVGQPESDLPAPQRRSLASASTTSFQDPEELRSIDGRLRVTLTVMKAYNRIGDDPVFLRSYNGHLVGPTLRAQPGDTLRVTLKNDLEPEPSQPGHSNSLHGFNTTNLHTHGLHVSPSGISDNILLEVPPRSTQEYEIKIPAKHPCGTFWYHAHKHGSTAAQVASGMSGALIIFGGMDEVPEIKRARERIFVLQQISYLYQNCFPDPDNPGNEICFDLPEGVIEEEYVNWIFGPRTWDRLGRFTTVNGVQLPVIRVRPGAVERWRLIHSGVRERIELKLESAGRGASQTLPLYEIAADGLSLGKVAKRETIELWPGYRSDALVRFPETPGEFLLVDERTAANRSLNGEEESRKYIARVIVEGRPDPMPLPRSEQLAKFRLKSIPPEAVTGRQSATYGILLRPRGGVKFTVDGEEFNAHNPPRQLTVGDVDEWTLRSKGDVGPVSHPFHIHVNPFEVYSILDEDGDEQLTEPVWRDTVILHGGWTVKCRTRYSAFTGIFVNHCHILDHEDEGMMQLVEIIPADQAGAHAPAGGAPRAVSVASPYPARNWKLPDSTGAIRNFDEFRGQPTVLLFFKGYGCLHCAEQLAAFSERAAEFEKKGARVIGISTDSVKDLRTALKSVDCPFTLVADPDKQAFRDYGCRVGDALHGTFVIDPSGLVRWQSVSTQPFMNVDTVLAEVDRWAPSQDVQPAVDVGCFGDGSPQLELEVFNTPTGDDDYITWAPVPCRIRIASGATDDLKVVLKNDPPQPVPDGREQPLDGDVLFAASVEPGRTADNETLELTLPSGGSWVPFVIAGRFPQSSTKDKDAVIEVHDATASGSPLHTHALMVRIRKEHRKLTTDERRRWLEAVDYLHRQDVDENGMSRYMYFVHMHQAAAVGLTFGDRPDVEYYWPDLAHKGPGFIAWHRAYLLQFERELQKKFPDVALPYWVMTEKSELFAEDFVGANVVRPGTQAVEATFSPNNPLFGWTADIDGTHNQRLLRWAYGRDPGDTSFPNLLTDETLFTFRRFKDNYSLFPTTGTSGGFIDALESNPHNRGHNWTGPWMQNCQTSPRDPIFWIFHTGFDRQWAHWQYLYDRFDPSGEGNSYCPRDSFENPGAPCAVPTSPADCNSRALNTCTPINHHLNDAMWPWNEKSGQGASLKGNLPQPSFAEPFQLPFPKSTVDGLWPQDDANPLVGDMIDYQGLNSGRLDMGFAYDDSPYGIKRQPEDLIAQTPREDLRTFLDAKRSVRQRLDAASRLTPATVTQQSDVKSVLDVVRSADHDDAVRARALRIAQEIDAPEWIDHAIRVLKSPDDGRESLDAEAVKSLAAGMMQTASGEARKKEIMPVLHDALDDSRETVRLAALRALAPMGMSRRLTATLTQSLQQADKAAFKPLDAIKGLGMAGKSLQHADLIRPYLDHSDHQLRQAAVTELAADPGSRDQIRKLLADRKQHDSVRSAAIHALLVGGTDYLTDVLDVAGDTATSLRIRAEAVAAVGVVARSAAIPLNGQQLNQIVDRLSSLDAADVQRIGPVVGTAVLNATKRLKRLEEKN